MKVKKEKSCMSIDKLIVEESNRKNKNNLNLEQGIDNIDMETLASPKRKKSE
jgi:hypothetical protein